MGITDIEFGYMTRFGYFRTDEILNDQDVYAMASWTKSKSYFQQMKCQKMGC